MCRIFSYFYCVFQLFYSSKGFTSWRKFKNNALLQKYIVQLHIEVTIVLMTFQYLSKSVNYVRVCILCNCFFLYKNLSSTFYTIFQAWCVWFFNLRPCISIGSRFMCYEYILYLLSYVFDIDELLI